MTRELRPFLISFGTAEIDIHHHFENEMKLEEVIGLVTPDSGKCKPRLDA